MTLQYITYITHITLHYITYIAYITKTLHTLHYIKLHCITLHYIHYTHYITLRYVTLHYITSCYIHYITVSSKSVKQECPARASSKRVLSRVPCKTLLLLDDGASHLHKEKTSIFIFALVSVYSALHKVTAFGFVGSIRLFIGFSHGLVFRCDHGVGCWFMELVVFGLRPVPRIPPFSTGRSWRTWPMAATWRRRNERLALLPWEVMGNRKGLG